MAESASSSRIGLPTVIGAIFITLKLTGHITWSWWWVLAPFWISFLVWIVVLAGCIALIAMDR